MVNYCKWSIIHIKLEPQESTTKYTIMHTFYQITELNPWATALYYIHGEMDILYGAIIL